MTDLTPRGLPVGHGNSKIRRKQLDLMALDLALARLHVEIAEKEEEIERMHVHRGELVEELNALEQQFGEGK